jgi:hypothetical protein
MYSPNIRFRIREESFVVIHLKIATEISVETSEL